jgi:hypothetical protein
LGPDGGVLAATLVATCGPANEGEQCAGGICCGEACLEPGSFESCAACGLGCPACNAGCSAGTACVSQGATRLPDGGVAPVEVCLPVTCAPGVSGGDCAFGPSVPAPYEFAGGPGFTFEQSNSLNPFQLGNAGFCCNGACVDIAQDPNNCGLCGVVCSSGVCTLSVGGGAICLPTGPSDNCLATCGPGNVCVAGACLGSSCEQDVGVLPFCAAQDGNVGVCCPSLSGPGLLGPIPCVDAANDPLNCGGCGFQCPAGQSCTNGVCSGAPADCGIGRIGAFCNLDAGSGNICCPGTGCDDLSTDSRNCGACGNACAAGLSCIHGICIG